MDAERGVIGSMLLAPLEAIPVCVQKIEGKAEVFFDLRHQEIYKILVEMYDAREAIDLITLSDWLRFQCLYDSVGGVAYLATLTDAVPSAANVEYYLDILLEHYRSRQAIKISTSLVSAIYDHADESPALAERAALDLSELCQGNTAEEEVPMAQLIHGAINTIEEIHSTHGALTGLATGFADLDKMTTGLHGGEMIVIAGRPSLGKTTLGLNILEHVAVNLHLPVGMFSLEMTKESLALKLLCARARVNLRNLTDGFLAERDFPKITAAAGKLLNAPIHINDISGLSILGLRTRARRMHQQHGIKLLLIDYLQLLHAERGRNDNRQQEVSMISSGIKALAKELNVPVIAISQLNRSLEKDGKRRPMLADLRESGSIEQDADLVGFLYKPSDKDKDDEPDDPSCAAVNLYIGKQRNGPTGDIPFTFMKSYSRFESAAKVTSEEVYGSPQQTSIGQAELPVGDQE